LWVVSNEGTGLKGQGKVIDHFPDVNKMVEIRVRSGNKENFEVR
jgi:hypothetical protein